MYDLIIVGGGPSAMSAAIYAARYRLNTLVLAERIGGAIINAHDVQNYPGFKKISGLELMQKMEEQVKHQGVEIKTEQVEKIVPDNNTFKINDKYESKAVILATGTSRRKLNIPGEEEFIGKGVSYCATCDAPFFKDKTVAVIGGANSAAMAAQLLAEYAKKVYIVYRKEPMRAEPVRVEDLKENPKIEFIYNTNICEIKGTNLVEKVVLDCEFNGNNVLTLDGVFIEVGSIPSTVLANLLKVELNERNLIKVDPGQRTNIKGVYAAGDITTNSDNFWQLVTAVSEGAIAAHSVFLDIKDKKI